MGLALDLLQVSRWVRHAAAETAVAASVDFKANAADPTGELVVDCSEARFVLIEARTADVYVSSGRTDEEPPEPASGNRKVLAGTSLILQCRRGTVPWIKVKNVSGAATVAVEWGM